MILGPDGVVSGIRYVPSPNCDDRQPGEAVTLLVVHSISLPPGEYGGDSIERFFTNRLDAGAHPYFEGIRDLKVSAHFLVRRDGEVAQFVPTGRRAWHAGASAWRGRQKCNDFSIGVEMEGADDATFEPAQYDRLSHLIRVLRSRLPISAIAAHSDIAPGRKTDPGPHFDWTRSLRLLAAA
jgi:N-acetyl-anhydromuramoyl-L-alanine amidase